MTPLQQWLSNSQVSRLINARRELVTKHPHNVICILFYNNPTVLCITPQMDIIDLLVHKEKLLQDVDDCHIHNHHVNNYKPLYCDFHKSCPEITCNQCYPRITFGNLCIYCVNELIQLSHKCKLIFDRISTNDVDYVTRILELYLFPKDRHIHYWLSKLIFGNDVGGYIMCLYE